MLLCTLGCKYYAAEREGTLTLRDSMDGTGEHYAKWNKPGSERKTWYDLTYKWNLINKTNKWANRTRDTDIKNNLTVNRGKGEEVKGGKKGKGQVKKHVWRTHGQSQLWGVGFKVEGEEWVGQRRLRRENGDNCNWTTTKINK